MPSFSLGNDLMPSGRIGEWIVPERSAGVNGITLLPMVAPVCGAPYKCTEGMGGRSVQRKGLFLALVFPLFCTAPARAATVEGRVREAAPPQADIGGARVTLFIPDLSYFREVRTAADGRYVLPGVPMGLYRIGASARGRVYDERDIGVAEPASTADFLLGPDAHPGRWSIIGDTAPERFGASNSGTLQPDGKLVFCHNTIDPVIFDPSTGEKTFPAGSPSFQGCHMTTLLSDGEVLFVGGQGSGDFRDAVKTVKTWDPPSQAWTVIADLNEERWYPGLARLADGRLLSCGGGQRPDASRTPTCEIFDPDLLTWSPTGSLTQPTEYPPAVLLLTGQVLLSWYPPQLFDVSTEAWQATGGFVQSVRGYPGHSDHSLVLLPDGRVMAVGIEAPAPNGSMVEFYEPGGTGIWSLGPSPETLRSRPEVVLLPGGGVLAAGGKKEDGDPVPVNPWGYVSLADLYDPLSGTWKRAADMNVAREYHATSLLIPDGRVITTGGTGEPGNEGQDTSVEAYEPPYLFRGVRPRIDGVSTSEPCSGRTFDLSVSLTSAVTDVLLLGTSSVTHWMDGGIPRHLSLPFSQSGSTVTVGVPSDPVLAPQGWYILFVMVDDVPSEGRIVHLTRSVPEQVPGLTVRGRGPTDLEWSRPRSGGTPLQYDVATGRLADLRSSAVFGAGECLASGVQDTRYTETRSPSPAGEGYYYLVRARNGCFTGTYGSPARDQHGTISGLGCP